MLDPFSHRPTVVVVDGYSTGSKLPSAIHGRGWSVLHVETNPATPEFVRAGHSSDHYDGVLSYPGDPASLAEALHAAAPEAVIPGTDSGVSLADELSHRLGLPGNDPCSAPCRRDKYLMIERVARAGLSVPAQFKSSSPETLAEWAARRNEWPVVVKPLKSSGTDGVTFCHDRRAVYTAAAELLARPTRFGDPNYEVLAQERLVGEQYFVNTVSWADEHYVSEIWWEHKRVVPGAGAIGDWEELLTSDGPVQSVLRKYVIDVLHALGVSHGAAHTELMLGPNGPILIECNPRLQGSFLETAVQRCTGSDHLSLTLDAHLSHALPSGSSGAMYPLKAHSYCVWLIATQSGLLASLPGIDCVRALDSCHGVLQKAAVGDHLEPTIDGFTSPGIVYLVHESETQLERDYRAIRQLEKCAFYTFVP